jgi:predicted amidophosphoribosyltransferase
MPELRNCRDCGKLFVGSLPLCPDCRQAEDDAFGQVREYLRRHPAASIPETSEATGVAPALVRRFVEEGRLTLQGADAATCRICGVPVASGRICPRCLAEMRREPGGPARAAKAPSRGFYSRPAGGQ